METREEKSYQVAFTPSATYHFYQVLEYLYDHYPPDRAEQLADELEQMTQRLGEHPYRGVKEKWLSHLGKQHRFILFQRTKRAEIKIIYYVQEDEKMVYITDFFPTETDITDITGRSD